MTEYQDTIIVFTARSLDRIVRDGGSQAWVLNPVNARQCRWLICTQNRHNPDHEFSDAAEPHGTAFLIGKISGIVPSREPGADGRWLIAISEYARIQMPDLWDHGRNPVRYVSLADLGIDPANLSFTPMPAVAETAPPQAPHPSPAAAALTIAEAKRSLANTFGVKPEAIEITIRG